MIMLIMITLVKPVTISACRWMGMINGCISDLRGVQPNVFKAMFNKELNDALADNMPVNRFELLLAIGNSVYQTSSNYNRLVMEF